MSHLHITPNPKPPAPQAAPAPPHGTTKTTQSPKGPKPSAVLLACSAPPANPPRPPAPKPPRPPQKERPQKPQAAPPAEIPRTDTPHPNSEADILIIGQRLEDTICKRPTRRHDTPNRPHTPSMSYMLSKSTTRRGNPAIRARTAAPTGKAFEGSTASPTIRSVPRPGVARCVVGERVSTDCGGGAQEGEAKNVQVFGRPVKAI